MKMLVRSWQILTDLMTKFKNCLINLPAICCWSRYGLTGSVASGNCGASVIKRSKMKQCNSDSVRVRMCVTVCVCD